jgi:hypothetical protein
MRGSNGCGVTAICKDGNAVEDSAVTEAEVWLVTLGPGPVGPGA